MSKRRLKPTSDGRDHEDDPPMSRLFVVCNKNITDKNIRESFSKFGNIEEIKLLKERDGMSKGVAYVKFSKTSDAAAACESLHGSQIGESTRPIKVMIAASKQAGPASSKSRDDEKALRLFIITPKDFTEDNLYQEFSKYGQVDDITILKDRKTRDGKQFAYIRFTKFSSAALAYENCDEKYKAVFAEPKPPRSSSQDERAPLWSEDRGPIPPIQMTNIPGINLSLTPNDYLVGSAGGGVGGNLNENECILHVICSPMITHDQLWRLFDIVPNLDFCKMNNDGDGSQSATVVFKTPQAANHARQKLHGFEYPPGERLIVKFSSEMKSLSLLETQSDTNSASFCSVNLPPIQPLSKETAVAQRCFIVLSPNTLPTNLLKQVFCRFGNLIDVYLLSNRNCGYVKYSSTESAKQAITTLHGAEVYGVRLKVMEAEEPSELRKRSKIDES